MEPIAVHDRINLDKAARDEGFSIQCDNDGVWLSYEGLGMPASLRLYREPGRYYYVAVNHAAVAEELRNRWQLLPALTEPPAPGGFFKFMLTELEEVQDLIRDIYNLAHALPPEPARLFAERTAHMPRTTEAERMAVYRIGQDLFREALDIYWDGECAVTGVAERRLLRASHIKPWSECADDAERLDPYNGLLLAAHLDAAFDSGLVSFADDGSVLYSEALTEADRRRLHFTSGLRVLRLSPRHCGYLRWHRDRVFLR